MWAITAFNQIGLLEDTRLIPELTECSRQLLRAVDIRGKIDKLVVTGLLNTLAKFDPQLLAKMVQEGVPTVVLQRLSPKVSLFFPDRDGVGFCYTAD